MAVTITHLISPPNGTSQDPELVYLWLTNLGLAELKFLVCYLNLTLFLIGIFLCWMKSCFKSGWFKNSWAEWENKVTLFLLDYMSVGHQLAFWRLPDINAKGEWWPSGKGISLCPRLSPWEAAIRTIAWALSPISSGLWQNPSRVSKQGWRRVG